MDERVERNLKLQEFIGKETRRYCDIFEQNEGKKIFVHTNWAAFFFGPNWMFYRSMYAWGTLALIANYVIMFIGVFLVVALYLLGALKANNPTDIIVSLYVGAIICELMARLIFSLFADCIYRAYVFKNLDKTEGGASFGGVILCVILSGLIERGVSVLLEVIAAFI